MPSKITFTQKEEAALREIINERDNTPDEDLPWKYVISLLDKMEKAKIKPKTFSGVPVRDVVELAKKELGNRLALPEVLTGEWFSKMQRAINSGGITLESADKAVKWVAVNWGDSIWIDTLIYSIAKIAAGAGSTGRTVSKKTGFTPTKKSGWLGQVKFDTDE